MRDDLQNALIGQIKSEAHSSPDLTTMDDEQLRRLIEHLLEEKILWAKNSKPEVYREMSALNFREKRDIIDAVYESIRGLGVLGEIINDMDITG